VRPRFKISLFAVFALISRQPRRADNHRRAHAEVFKISLNSKSAPILRRAGENWRVRLRFKISLIPIVIPLLWWAWAAEKRELDCNVFFYQTA
jgi:hypothetical protein